MSQHYQPPEAPPSGRTRAELEAALRDALERVSDLREQCFRLQGELDRERTSFIQANAMLAERRSAMADVEDERDALRAALDRETAERVRWQAAAEGKP